MTVNPDPTKHAQAAEASMPAVTPHSVRTGQIRVGDVVLTHGMRVRIDRIRPYHPGGQGCMTGMARESCSLAWACLGTVTNLADVLAEGFVPRSFLYDSERDSRGPGHGREDFWNVQGNNLATWLVVRDAS